MDIVLEVDGGGVDANDLIDVTAMLFKPNREGGDVAELGPDRCTDLKTVDIEVAHDVTAFDEVLCLPPKIDVRFCDEDLAVVDRQIQLGPCQWILADLNDCEPLGAIVRDRRFAKIRAQVVATLDAVVGEDLKVHAELVCAPGLADGRDDERLAVQSIVDPLEILVSV